MKKLLQSSLANPRSLCNPLQVKLAGLAVLSGDSHLRSLIIFNYASPHTFPTFEEFASLPLLEDLSIFNMSISMGRSAAAALPGILHASLD